MDEQLLEMPWGSLQIGDSSFLCKIFFTDSGYTLLISDLSSVWYEETDSNVIQERLKELNKRLKAPISSFLAHLSQLILPLLESKSNGPAGFTCHRTGGELMLQVKSQLSGLPFYWEFHCKEASMSMVCRHFLCPLMSMTKALDLQVQTLFVLLGRKDAEILDYQETGAVLSRGRLKTEVFEETSFQETFLKENMKDLSSSRPAPGFSDRLQTLYRAVTAPPAMDENPEPSGLSHTSTEEPVVEDVSPAAGKELPPTQEGPGAWLSQSSSQVPLSAPPSLTQRPPSAVSKPKRKKAKGLFT
ncbi:non-homologous end-joining factor 1 [Discoglossus pictus]